MKVFRGKEVMVELKGVTEQEVLRGIEVAVELSVVVMEKQGQFCDGVSLLGY